jgi:hypothetical protein
VQTHDFEIREGRKSGKDGEVVLKAGTVPPPPDAAPYKSMVKRVA